MILITETEVRLESTALYCTAIATIPLPITHPQSITSKPHITFNMSTVPSGLNKSSNPPIIPLSFDGNQPPVITLHPFSSNDISTKSAQPEEDASVEERLNRLKKHYEDYGMRRFCEGVMLCHENSHPHVLLLQIANSFHKLYVSRFTCSRFLQTNNNNRPGGWLKHDEDEIEGFQRIMDDLFEPDSSAGSNTTKWQIGDACGSWWRPNFETALYPYLPTHVTRPKECKKMYLIPLPQKNSKSLFVLTLYFTY